MPASQPASHPANKHSTLLCEAHNKAREKQTREKCDGSNRTANEILPTRNIIPQKSTCQKAPRCCCCCCCWYNFQFAFGMLIMISTLFKPYNMFREVLTARCHATVRNGNKNERAECVAFSVAIHFMHISLLVTCGSDMLLYLK